MEQLFIKLLNMSISAGYLVLALILLRPLLKKAPKYISCLLWGLVGLRLCLPVSIESILSLIPSTQTVPADIMMDRTPAIDSGLSSIDTVINPIISHAFTPSPVASANPLQIWMFLAANLWVVGMIAMALYAAISYWLLRRRLREAVRQEENIWICDRVNSPFLLGIFRPRIYLPSNLPEDTAAYVIAHEKAHLRRRDHWWKPLGFLILTVYWFNPLVWAAYILLCRDIEYACDEKVLRDMGEGCKKAYSEALISCSAPRKMITACPVAFGEDGVKGRVRSVLNYKKPAFWIVLVAILAGIAAAVCFLTDPAQNTGKTENLFGGIFETGECHYSYVVSEDKETQSNELVFCIDPQGQVYKDYGGGEREYIGTLQSSELTLEALNHWLSQQGCSRIELEDRPCWELLDASGNRMHIFYPGTEGKAGIVSFFSDGRIMNWFTLDKSGVFTGSQATLTYQFNATVISNRDGRLLVEPYANENEAKTSDRFYVPLPEGVTDTFAEDDPVKIVYDGMIQELYPAILPNVISVTKLASEDTLWNTQSNYQYPATFDIDGDGIEEDCYFQFNGPQTTPSGELTVTENNIVEYRFDLNLQQCQNAYLSLQNQEVFLVTVSENGSEVSHRIRIRNNTLITEDPLTLQQNVSTLSSDAIGLAALREKYPQFFGLSTGKGLEVYVWDAGEYRCGVRSGTNREATREELWAFGEGATLAEMALILYSYGISREDVAVLYSYHPAFSGPYPNVPEDQTAIEDTLFAYLMSIEVIQEPSLIVSGDFDINTQYKLIIYAYQLGENAWRFQFVKNSRLGHTIVSLMKLDSVSLETARQLLSSYDLAPEEIPVIVYTNPYSSYLYETGPAVNETARKLLFHEE